MFSLERYITVKYSISQSTRNRAASIIIGGFISVLSMVYAQLIHLVSIKTIVITCLNLVDMAALVISDVYIWTQALIPAACLAFLLKFTYVLVIWLLHIVENSMTYQIAFTHFFQNALDLFTVCIPFLVITNHRRLSQGRLRNRGRVNPGIKNETHVKTLDGKSLRMKGTIHDHFDFLKNHWK
uniref:G_PROTEIN_RECEP_F1_2 domain-containing protein n=1 Tax=Caenorhabditis tropicalis TaxID=1561998 RepID=A0A1I7T8B4_9PELO